MDDKTPFVPDTKPKEVFLEEGKTYEWCTCGLSGNQPFCDYSHFGTTHQHGLLFTAEKTGLAKLCVCKHTKTPPYCDGSCGNK